MDVLEQVGFEARNSEYVDAKSGVSARMAITAFENLLSTAERRMLLASESKTAIRLSDFMGVIPAVTGKVELVYEGEQEGAAFVAETLIDEAIKSIFPNYFPKISKLEKKDAETPYDELIAWFFNHEGFELLEDDNDQEYQSKLDSIPPLNHLIRDFGDDIPEQDHYFLKELLLWGLVAYKKLSKQRLQSGIEIKDLYGGYISGEPSEITMLYTYISYWG